jgi:hypothetical protein
MESMTLWIITGLAGAAGLAGLVYGVRCILTDHQTLQEDEAMMREIERWRDGR